MLTYAFHGGWNMHGRWNDSVESELRADGSVSGSTGDGVSRDRMVDGISGCGIPRFGGSVLYTDR